MSRIDATGVFGISLRTIFRYLKRYLDGGEEALKDKRRAHKKKLSGEDEVRIVVCKKERPHRSARFIRDYLRLPVSEEAVRLVLVRHGFNRISLPPIKPVKRFVVKEPNELW